MSGKFSSTILAFLDFRFRYCRWIVCENGEEYEKDGAPLNTLFK